ncbi:MAG: hypothetical protein OEV01_11125 [Nitrospira sp.]|nr:hypothetical protein [Nitrospira sp.]
MNHTSPPSFRLWISLLTLGYLPLLLVGCAGSRPTIPIHEAPLGSVFLEPVSDSSFQASHPIKLSETTVADVLRGIHTKEKAGFLLLLGKAAKSTNLNDIRTFSEDDIAFLTPHLTAALTQATSAQRVGFRVHSTAFIAPSAKTTPQQETTAGYLFADGLSLHVTLTQYRHYPGKRPTASQKEPRPLPDTDGLRDREVTFLPEGAVRSDLYDRSSWVGKSEDRSLAIDYQLLARLLSPPPPPVPAPQPAPVVTTPPPPAQAIPPQAPPIVKQDTELQAFKEEMKALRKKVDEQEAELQRLKNPPLKKKSTP